MAGGTIEQGERARRIGPIVGVQNEDNLLARQHDTIVDYCASNSIAFFPWFPLSRGRYAAAEATLDEIGARLAHGAAVTTLRQP